MDTLIIVGKLHPSIHTCIHTNTGVGARSPVWRRRVLIPGWRRPGSQDQCRPTPSRLPSRPLLLLLLLPPVLQQIRYPYLYTFPHHPIPAHLSPAKVPEAAATYVGHGCWSGVGLRGAQLSRRTAAEDTRYPRTTARRWFPPAPPITVMYTLMYTPLGYVHSVHSFTRSGLPSWTGDGFRYKHILQSVECLVVDTAGQGARPLFSKRASRQPPPLGFGASPALRVPAHVINTSLIRMPTPATVRLLPGGGHTPFLDAERVSPQHTDGTRDGGDETSLVRALAGSLGHQEQRQATRADYQPCRASLSPILILKCSSATCWPSLRPQRRPGLLLPLLSPLMLHHTLGFPTTPPAQHHTHPALLY